MRVRFFQTGYVLVFLLITAACGAEPSNEKAESEEGLDEQEPVTVTIATTYDSEWLEEMKPQIEEELPHITIEFMEMPFVDQDEFTDAVFTGHIPDIIPAQEQRRDFMLMRDFELEYDFEYIIKEKDFDLSVYDEEIIESFRNATPTGGIVALPHQSNYFALHYNKDIFDRFGVDYPNESMTWFEVLDLAAELTREEDGVEYYGFSFNSWLAWFIFTQFEQNFIDPDTNEVNVTQSEAIDQIFRMLERYASIPGNVPNGEWGGTFEDGNVAMDAGWARTWAVEEGIEGVNFDFAPFPTWEENKGIGVEPNATAWMITSTSEHKEAAFDVLAYITSPEARLPEIRKGRVPAFADPEIRDQFLADVEGAENYHLEALYALTPSAGPPEISRFENNAPLREMMEKYVLEHQGEDPTSFLREVETVIENYVIEQEKLQ